MSQLSLQVGSIAVPTAGGHLFVSFTYLMGYAGAHQPFTIRFTCFREASTSNRSHVLFDQQAAAARLQSQNFSGFHEGAVAEATVTA